MTNVLNYLLIIPIFAAAIAAPAQNVHIPDPNFKAYLVDNFDTNNDGEISTAEAEAVTGSIQCNNLNIVDLTGIGAFVNLTFLDCRNNWLSGLPELSSLTKLLVLDCCFNQLAWLPDLSALANLEELCCALNQLTALPALPKQPSLRKLACGGNQLTNLPDLTIYPNMEIISFFDNQLTTIPDITGLNSLRLLILQQNLFDEGDCPDIRAVQALDLQAFIFNPQKDESTLNCENAEELPLAKLEIDDGFSGEWGDIGRFVVTVEKTLSEALSLSYSIDGSAEHGVDYETLPGQVTIPAGAISGEILIVPIADLEAEPDETVRVALVEGDSYRLGNPSEATITIGNQTPVPDAPGFIDGDNFWIGSDGSLFCRYPDPNLDGADLSGSGDLVYVVTFENGCEILHGPVVVSLGEGERWPLVLSLDADAVPEGDFVIRTRRARAGQVEATLSGSVVVAAPTAPALNPIPPEPISRIFSRWLPHVPRLAGGFSATLKLVNGHPGDSVTVRLLGFAEDGAYLGMESVVLPPAQTAYRDVYGAGEGGLFPKFEDRVAAMAIVEPNRFTDLAIRYTSLANGFGAWTREVDFREGEAVGSRFEMEGRIAEAYQDGVAVLNLAGDRASEVWLSMRDARSEAVSGETFLGALEPGAKLLALPSSLFPYTPGAKYLFETRDPSATIQVVGLTFSGGDFFAEVPVQKRANTTTGKRIGGK